MNSGERIKVGLVINYMPHYREGFYSQIFCSEKYQFDVFCHKADERLRLKTVESEFSNVRVLPLYSIRDRFWVSVLPFHILLSRRYQVLVIEGNPRFVSHFLLASLCMLLGKSVLIWAMAKSPNPSFAEKIRLAWMRRFKDVIVYTEREVQYLKRKGYLDNSLTSINNGLNQRSIDAARFSWPSDSLEAWRRDRGIEEVPLFLSCARLERKNRFDMALRAFGNFLKSDPRARYAIVGDGPEAQVLRELAHDLGVSREVFFVGAVHSEAELAPWFMSATVFLHPGSIGLSIFHSLGYGLPVVTNDNVLAHAPEFSALEPGVNGLVFKEGDVDGLVEVLREAVRLRAGGFFPESVVSHIPREVHNTDQMAKNFLRALDVLLSK